MSSGAEKETMISTGPSAFAFIMPSFGLTILSPFLKKDDLVWGSLSNSSLDSGVSRSCHFGSIGRWSKIKSSGGAKK